MIEAAIVFDFLNWLKEWSGVIQLIFYVIFAILLVNLGSKRNKLAKMGIKNPEWSLRTLKARESKNSDDVNVNIGIENVGEGKAEDVEIKYEGTRFNDVYYEEDPGADSVRVFASNMPSGSFRKLPEEVIHVHFRVEGVKYVETIDLAVLEDGKKRQIIQVDGEDIRAGLKDYCPHCAVVIEENHRYCPNCNSKISKEHKR